MKWLPIKKLATMKRAKATARETVVKRILELLVVVTHAILYKHEVYPSSKYHASLTCNMSGNISDIFLTSIQGCLSSDTNMVSAHSTASTPL